MDFVVVFNKSKETLGIKLKTVTKDRNDVTKKIYKFKDENCEKYFEASTRFIGIILENIFYVVNLVDKTELDQQYKEIISDQKKLSLLLGPISKYNKNDRLLRQTEY